jgi:hypothetical protein
MLTTDYKEAIHVALIFEIELPGDFDSDREQAVMAWLADRHWATRRSGVAVDDAVPWGLPYVFSSTSPPCARIASTPVVSSRADCLMPPIA